MQCMEVWGGNQASDSGVIMPGLDAWVVSRPFEGDDAGGDIHYVSSCATGRITRILVADVSGHGRKVAAVATILRSLMRRFVNYIDQTRLVRALNVEFAGLSDAGTFATAVVATYWAPTASLAISNAGHPRPLRYRASARRWEAVDAREAAPAGEIANIPLGIAAAAYDEAKLHLSPNDLLLIYTDSLIESADPAGRQLGERGLIDLVSTLDASRPDALIPALLTAIDTRAGRPPNDDVTVLLLRPNDLIPKTGFFRANLAGLRIIRETIASLLSGRAIPWPQMTFANIFGAMFRRPNARIDAHSRD
jgi:phosphoserine phosphatase RsbU/P